MPVTAWAESLAADTFHHTLSRHSAPPPQTPGRTNPPPVHCPHFPAAGRPRPAGTRPTCSPGIPQRTASFRTKTPLESNNTTDRPSRPQPSQADPSRTIEHRSVTAGCSSWPVPPSYGPAGHPAPDPTGRPTDPKNPPLTAGQPRRSAGQRTSRRFTEPRSAGPGHFPG